MLLACENPAAFGEPAAAACYVDDAMCNTTAD
jgi:hypothetical protein